MPLKLCKRKRSILPPRHQKKKQQKNMTPHLSIQLLSMVKASIFVQSIGNFFLEMCLRFSLYIHNLVSYGFYKNMNGMLAWRLGFFSRFWNTFFSDSNEPCLSNQSWFVKQWLLQDEIQLNYNFDMFQTNIWLITDLDNLCAWHNTFG